MPDQANAEPLTMSLQQAVEARRSVRGFLPQPVAQPLLDKVFRLAQRAPSNCNIQPWKVYVVSGQSCERLRERLYTAAQTQSPRSDYAYPGTFEGEYRTRQVECAKALYGNMGVARDDRRGRVEAMLRNFRFFDAPHALFIGMHKDFGAAVALDVGAYLQTLMLVMTAEGIASCAQASLREYPDIVREELDIPDDIHLITGLSFGYENPSIPANNTRMERDDISDSVRFYS